MPEDIGYIVTVYTARGVAPDRTDFEDKVKAEKAFTDAKSAAILWQARPPTQGLGWIKLKEKETPPPAPAAPPAPAKPPVVAAAKPAAVGTPVPPATPAAVPPSKP